MTPSIRVRRSPRCSSITFHRLWWVLRREAVLRVISTSPEDLRAQSRRRAQICFLGFRDAEHQARAIIREYRSIGRVRTADYPREI